MTPDTFFQRMPFQSLRSGGVVRSAARAAMVVPSLPSPHTNAGDWRAYAMACLVHRHLPLVMVPLRPSDNDDVSRRMFEKNGITAAESAEGPRGLAAILARRGIETLIFEKYHGVNLLPFMTVFPLARRVVIDVHELEYLTAYRLGRAFGEPDRAQAARRRAEEIELLRWADLLVAISEEEERRLRAVFPSKTIVRVPTCVSVGVTPAVPFEQRAGLCFPACFAHAPNRDAARYFMHHIFPLLRKQKNMPLDLLGFGSDGIDTTGLPGMRGRGWVKDLSGALAAYRVAVCPLRYGAGARKKILDAAEAGTPVVSTRIGAEGLRLRRGRDILIADTPADFARAIEGLYGDAGRWNKIATRAHQRVKERYSLEVMADAVSSRLCSCLG